MEKEHDFSLLVDGYQYFVFVSNTDFCHEPLNHAMVSNNYSGYLNDFS